MDVREAMEAAQEQLDSQAETVTEAPAPAETTTTPAPETAAAEPAEKTAAQRARDESGRFAAKPKEETKVTEKPAAGAPKAALPPPPTAAQGKPVEVPSTPPPVASAGQPVRAPQSWKPATRELAAKLPAEFHPILEEANRREVETNRVMQETAQARQMAQQAQQLFAPHIDTAKALGMDVVQLTESTLRTVGQLHSGSPQQKAAIAAQIIAQYGINTDLVNEAMQGQASSPPDLEQAITPVLQRMLAPLMQQAEAAKRNAAVAQEANDRKAVDDFLSTDPRYFNDSLLRVMTDLKGTESGRNMNLKQLYDWACRVDEPTWEQMQKDKSMAAARTPKPVTEQQRRAASSVRSQPAAAPAAQPKGIRGAMEAAAEKLGM